MDAVLHSVGMSATSVDTRPWLAPYRFKKGAENPARTNPKAHRQPGSRDAATIYLESLPLKARQWVKSTDAKILSEARQLVAKSVPELSLPSDRSVDGSASGPHVVVFIGDGSLPRQHDRVIETLSTHPSLTEAVL